MVLKTIKKIRQTEDEMKRDAIILKQFSNTHPGIVKYYDDFWTTDGIYNYFNIILFSYPFLLS